MKNNRLFKVTDTGVRIPQHKPKWMTPPSGGHHDELAFPATLRPSHQSNFLVVSHLHIHQRASSDVPSENIIEVADPRGGNSDET